MKYTTEDIIICESKAKELGLKVGMEVATGNKLTECIIEADSGYFHKLEKIDFSKSHPFTVDIEGIESKNYSSCIIKKEPEVKYIPYDLSKKEDRDKLRGKWIVDKDNGFEQQIIGFRATPDGDWIADVHHSGAKAVALVESYIFLDTGLPVGKPVEEVEE